LLITADDALKSAAKAGDRTSTKVNEGFEEVIHLLCRFEKDFLLDEPTLDPSIGETVTRMSDRSKSPSAILYALKKNLHAKVKFLHASLPLNVDVS
jgi:hypothetical protein